MPTTRPLDEDELGDVAGGQLKPIAGFNQPVKEPVGSQPRANVPQNTAARIKTYAAPTVNIDSNVRMRGIRTPGVSLTGKQAGAPSASVACEPEANMSPRHEAKQRNEYTEAQLLQTWNAFIDSHREEHLLTNAMRASTPVRENGDVFRVSQSNVHLRYIREHLARITDYVRKELKNDDITFNLNEVSEDSPLAWNDRQFLGHMMDDHPELREFISSLRLSIL